MNQLDHQKQQEIAKGPHVYSREAGYTPAQPEHQEYPKWIDGKLVDKAQPIKQPQVAQK